MSIPESFEGSWYTGSVSVGLKNCCIRVRWVPGFLTCQACNRTPPWANQDGGNEQHTVCLFWWRDWPQTNLFVCHLSLIALFLNRDVDFLVASRTAPKHSWRNPVERLMSIIHLGFQSVGLMRTKRSDEFESKIHNRNSLEELRNACDFGNDTFKSMEPVRWCTKHQWQLFSWTQECKQTSKSSEVYASIPPNCLDIHSPLN